MKRKERKISRNTIIFMVVIIIILLLMLRPMLNKTTDHDYSSDPVTQDPFIETITYLSPQTILFGHPSATKLEIYVNDSLVTTLDKDSYGDFYTSITTIVQDGELSKLDLHFITGETIEIITAENVLYTDDLSNALIKDAEYFFTMSRSDLTLFEKLGSNVKMLVLSDFESGLDYESFNALKNLQALHLYENGMTSNLEKLANNKLSYLKLGSVDLEDCMLIKSLKHVRVLDIETYGELDLSHVDGLSNLRRLSLEGYPLVNGTNNTNIEYLYLKSYDPYSLSNLSGYINENLKHLAILGDIEGTASELPTASNLESLFLSSQIEDGDFDYVKAYPKVQSVVK